MESARCAALPDSAGEAASVFGGSADSAFSKSLLVLDDGPASEPVAVLASALCILLQECEG